MPRIGNGGSTAARLLGASFGLALLATAPAAAGPGKEAGDAPHLPYAAYAADEHITLAGRLVQPAGAARREAAMAREIARVRASQPYQPHPAIWKIGDADTTIYLFGTIHSLPPGFRWRNPALESVIVHADVLLLESVDDANDGVTFREGLPKAQAMPPLLQRVSRPLRARLASLEATLPRGTVRDMDAMPTWIAAMEVGTVRDLMIGDMPGEGADDWLEAHFRASGRPVEAIEDSKQVVSSINTVPEAVQRQMLEDALTVPDRTHAEIDAPAHAWARGEVGPDSPLIIAPEDLDPSSAMADPMLAKRNMAWVDTLLGKELARPGTILFAAGAGHFVGPGSVIDLLEKRGVRVERVQ